MTPREQLQAMLCCTKPREIVEVLSAKRIFTKKDVIDLAPTEADVFMRKQLAEELAQKLIDEDLLEIIIDDMTDSDEYRISTTIKLLRN